MALMILRSGGLSTDADYKKRFRGVVAMRRHLLQFFGSKHSTNIYKFRVLGYVVIIDIG